MTKFTIIVLILFSLSLASAFASIEASKAKLLSVIEPYTDTARKASNKPPLRYASRSVARNGNIPDALDCITFACPVLHRYQGKAWSEFDPNVAGMWGDDLARKYKLGTALYTETVAAHLRDIDQGRLPEGVFYFDMRNARGWERNADGGGQGHVGFLIIEGTGRSQVVTQIHMSGTESATGKKGGGLAYNDDRWKAFLIGTAYGNEANRRTSKIHLYRLSE